MDPILYRNSANTVFLLDIPTSIAAAQGIKSRPARLRLLSRKPLTEPYGGAQLENARLKNNPNGFNEELHRTYEELSVAALKHIEASWGHRQWCLPRSLAPPFEPTQSPSPEDSSTKRKRNKSPDPSDGELRNEGLPIHNSRMDPNTIELNIPGEMLANMVKDYPNSISRSQRRISSDQEFGHRRIQAESHYPEWFPRELAHISKNCRHDDYDANAAYDYFYNTESFPVTLWVCDMEDENPYSFLIPPRASFLLSDCRRSSLLRSTIKNMSQKDDHPRKFDLVIMDPPWSNASASHKKGYQTHDLKELKKMLFRMDLDMVIAPQGVVCIWITNAERVRQCVLGPGGLFEHWGIVLVEEWLWIKTTVSGVPQSPIASGWRKPYEVLLVGRIPNWMQPEDQALAGKEAVKRRVIAAVPDLHSRKPCVKSLMEELILKRGEGEYAGLELFGRYAVAGWFVWGNEAIKYNWDVYWKEKTEQDIAKTEEQQMAVPGQDQEIKKPKLAMR